MSHAGEKRSAEVALGDAAAVRPDEGGVSTRLVLERRLGKHLYWRLGPLERYDSFPVKRIFPWGVPREIWELIAKMLAKKDLDALALVNHDLREQVWLTRQRTMVIPSGFVSEALWRSRQPSCSALLNARNQLDVHACVADVDALQSFLDLHTSVASLHVRSAAETPFSLPPSLSTLRCLSLTLTQTPLPITQPLSMRNLCLELTRWTDTARDIQCISLQTSLVTLKLFVNKIASPRAPPLLDIAPFTSLRRLDELHVVSYQLNRPLLSLPYIPSLRKLELHNLAICPTDLFQYSSLLSLRFSLLSMSTDVDDTIKALLKQNTALRSLGLSWDGDDASFPCHCMRSAPLSIEKLALAPLVPFCELSHLTGLVHLDLRSCPNAFSTAYLTALTALRTLVIDERPPFRMNHWSDLLNLRKILLVPTFGEQEEVREIEQQVRVALPRVELVVDPPEKDLEL